MLAQFEVFREHMLGAFARRISHLHEVPLDVIEDEVHTAFEAIADEMNARREAAINRGNTE